MAGEYVFSLIQVTKRHEKKTILENVNLSFFFAPFALKTSLVKGVNDANWN